VQVPVELGHELASLIPDAKLVEYPDGDHALARGNVSALLGDVEEFITGHRESSSSELERILATVMFTDIVGSTHSAAEIGDQAWRRLLDTHDQLAKQMVEKHRGVLVKSTGDGILATFDGPGRAVRCLWRSEQPQSRSACPPALVCIPVRLKSEIEISAV
jgi:class 3 adenylate cyclase